MVSVVAIIRFARRPRQLVEQVLQQRGVRLDALHRVLQRLVLSVLFNVGVQLHVRRAAAEIEPADGGTRSRRRIGNTLFGLVFQLLADDVHRHHPGNAHHPETGDAGQSSSQRGCRGFCGESVLRRSAHGARSLVGAMRAQVRSQPSIAGGAKPF